MNRVCKKCKESKDLLDFTKRSSSPLIYKYICKECQNAYKRKRYADKPEYHRKKSREYAAKERYSKKTYERHLKNTYGISLNDYNRLLTKQNNTCLICEKHEDTIGKLVVDHCHSTGRVRGLLCSKCNSGIGLLGDSPSNVARAFTYLTCEEMWYPPLTEDACRCYARSPSECLCGAWDDC